MMPRRVAQGSKGWALTAGLSLPGGDAHGEAQASPKHIWEPAGAGQPRTKECPEQEPWAGRKVLAYS